MESILDEIDSMIGELDDIDFKPNRKKVSHLCYLLALIVVIRCEYHSKKQRTELNQNNMHCYL